MNQRLQLGDSDQARKLQYDGMFCVLMDKRTPSINTLAVCRASELS